MSGNMYYVCRARVGTIRTPHGSISTPGFVGVGTNGTMKGLTAQQTIDTGLQLMFWYAGKLPDGCNPRVHRYSILLRHLDLTDVNLV